MVCEVTGKRAEGRATTAMATQATLRTMKERSGTGAADIGVKSSEKTKLS